MRRCTSGSDIRFLSSCFLSSARKSLLDPSPQPTSVVYILAYLSVLEQWQTAADNAHLLRRVWTQLVSHSGVVSGSGSAGLPSRLSRSRPMNHNVNSQAPSDMDQMTWLKDMAYSGIFRVMVSSIV